MYRKLSAWQYPGNQPYPHTFTGCVPVSQSSSQVMSICVRALEWELYRCYSSAVHVFLLKCVLLFDELLLRWGLNHTKSIECACRFGCVGLCLRVFQIWWHGSVHFLKRYVGAFEAHGSSCCVPSYFPGSVSIWLYAGCSSETPRQLKTQSRYPGPSGCFASLGCFLVPGH